MGSEEENNDDLKPSQDIDDKPQLIATDIERAGKLFVGGLARETTSAEFEKHFEKYGEIIDSVIMKDKIGVSRGFGYVTFVDSSVRDKVIQDTHILNGKQVDIKPAIPRGSSKDYNEFKTKKIFVGGIPTSVDDDEFKEIFMQFGEVKEHQIMRELTSEKSRGFGFITYESEETVDLLLAKGDRIVLRGIEVEIKKAEPKKPKKLNLAPLPSRRSSDSRSSFSGNSEDSYGGGYSGSGGPYKSTGGYGNGRSGGYGGGRSGGYGGYGGGYGSGVGPHIGEPPSGDSGRYGEGGGSGYNIGGYGSGGPYGELGGAYGGPSSSYGGGYGTGGSGILGAYGGAGGSGLLGAYGGTGSEGYNRGGGRYPMGGGRGGGGGYDGGRRGGGGGGGRGPSYGSSRYHPYGR